jgi:hypothetical protein
MKTPRLAFLACAALPAALVAQSASWPKFVVPDTPDATITTRATNNRGGRAVNLLLYLKGARQRREERLEVPDGAGPPIPAHGSHAIVRISQCDERRRLMLNRDAKTYAYDPIEDPASYIPRVQAGAAHQSPSDKPSGSKPSPQAPTGPKTTITIDAADTGERKQVGPFVARHVVTTTTQTVDDGRGGVHIDRQDGWYIDAPEPDCTSWEGVAMRSMLVPHAPPPNVEFKVRGTARRGYPIEETHRMGGNYPIVARIELVEFSAAPLDAALFTVPPDYSAALPHPYGGYDLTRPDTFMNRVQAFREVVGQWTDYILRNGLQGILPGTQPPARY